MAARLLATGGPGPGFYTGLRAVYVHVARPLRPLPRDLNVVADPSARYALKLASLEKLCPWYQQALSYWQRRLGTSNAARFAVACRLHDIKASTMDNYRGKWEMFVGFCADHQLDALPAAPDTLQLYLGWHAERGQVHADSMGQYFSAVTKAHEHCGFDSPMYGNSEVSSTLKGLAKLQKSVYDVDSVMYLPARHVVFDWALGERGWATAACASVPPSGKRRYQRLSYELRIFFGASTGCCHARVQFLRLRACGLST